MANQIVGNVIIVDSAMGNSTYMITGSDQWPRQIYVNAIKLSMSNTAALLQISQANTANVIVELDKWESLIHFANPQIIRDLKIPVCSNGTAWIYLA